MQRSVLLGMCAALLLLGGGAGRAELIRNESMGISVEKPNAWSLITLKSFRENLGKVETANKELAETTRKLATPPIVGFTKFPEPHADLNPSFRINVRPLGGAQAMSARQIAGFALGSVRGLFPDIVMEQEPVDVIVGGLPGIYWRANYTVRSGGQDYPTLSEMWIVPRGGQLIMIGGSLRKDESNGTRAEIKAIVDSVKLAADE